MGSVASTSKSHHESNERIFDLLSPSRRIPAGHDRAQHAADRLSEYKCLRRRELRSRAALARELFCQRRVERIEARTSAVRERVLQEQSVDTPASSIRLEDRADEQSQPLLR